MLSIKNIFFRRSFLTPDINQYTKTFSTATGAPRVTIDDLLFYMFKTCIETDKRAFSELRKMLEAKDLAMIAARKSFALRSKLEGATSYLLITQSRLNVLGALEYIKDLIRSDETIAKISDENGIDQDNEFLTLSQDNNFKEDFLRSAKANGINGEESLACVPNILQQTSKYFDDSGLNMGLIEIPLSIELSENAVFALCFLLRRYHISYLRLNKFYEQTDFIWPSIHS
jgi:hypothetical protein